jgi:hypothetical protein
VSKEIKLKKIEKSGTAGISNKSHACNGILHAFHAGSLLFPCLHFAPKFCPHFRGHVHKEMHMYNL